MPHRCVFGCSVKGVALHVFPNAEKFPERFEAWVNLVGGKLETSSDYEFYKKKRICDVHFTDEHRNRFKRLNAKAVPTILVPEMPVTRQPDTSLGNGSYITVSVPASKISETPATQQTEEPVINNITSVESVLTEHNYSVMSRLKRRTLDEGVPGYCKQEQRSKIKQLQMEVNRLRKRGLSYKQRLENAKKMSSSVAFQTVVQHMTKQARLLVHMQKQSRKKPKGRRYSLQEKILALSLYKKSPKCYRLLCEYFSLPSSKAMKRLLGKIKLTPGINNIIFNKIKETMATKDPADRLCSLIFDEMSITPQINYVAHKDKLEGFACNINAKFADHVIVFMVKGVTSNFKQPIAYYFTNALTKVELKTMVKSVIRNALKSGLIILNTVCDQSSVNVGAIKDLVLESNDCQGTGEVIRIMGHDIVPLYDTPHVIKGFRNNLLTKDLSYTTNGEEKIIKWDYFQMVYNADKSYGELRLLDKLTEEHVTPEKINKMRVKSATQVFSHSVAVVAEHLTARGDLPDDCKKIVEITLLLDNLFDTLNVSSLSIPNGKKFKGPVKKYSPHHQLWQKAKEVLRTIKFLKKVKEGNKVRFVEATVPSVHNMIKTIEGVERLWKVLSSKYRIDAMLTRNLNQDPLENFFGNIRSYGARNVAPNTIAFEGAFKALLLNNFSSPHSRRANCEQDANECLQTLIFFLTEKNDLNVSDETEIAFNDNCEICSNPPEEDDAGQSNYVCGWVLKKCLQKVVKNCKYCRLKLLDQNSKNRNNALIRAKEYENKKWLCYPSKELEKYFKDVQHIAVSFLKQNVPINNLKETMTMLVGRLIAFPFKCNKHEEDLRRHFLSIMLNVIIYSWCRSINRILSGKLIYNGSDEIKKAAQIYCNKRKHYKNRK